jgi:hypothetical protein
VHDLSIIKLRETRLINATKMSVKKEKYRRKFSMTGNRMTLKSTQKENEPLVLHILVFCLLPRITLCRPLSITKKETRDCCTADKDKHKPFNTGNKTISFNLEWSKDH